MSTDMSTEPSGEREYVLGTGGDELERLGLQHRLWSDAAHEAWKRAGVAPGLSVLDIGCGPGYAAFDLAQIVQGSGRVVGVDESKPFVAHVREQGAARRLAQLDARVGDVQQLGAVLGPDERFDLAYARWVLCFVPDPGAVIRGAAAALKPGGRLVLHDYFNYESMTAAPRRESFTRTVAATARSWRAPGGDPDVMARVPRLVREHGLELVHLQVHQRIARPGESMWHWVATWWRTFTPKLVKLGELSAEDERRFHRDFDAMTAETDFVVLPTVFEIIARKPS
jgi:ubiquinone/menaquinone biosynthesis C-methylase UbiE